MKENIMPEVRWTTPFPHSFAYKLFEQHFTELNKMYWANVPASNTIEKEAMTFHSSGGDTLTDFFLIPDKDDHRLASNFNEWKINYREFLNFTRLNMVLSLCSCFEIYLRSIISLAIESKPGVILGNKDVVDGAKLLKTNKTYCIYNENTYPFYKHVDSVCRGDWFSRLFAYKNLFGTAPFDINNTVTELDALRKLRNNIAHYYGREKSKYETPIILRSESATRVTHDRLIKFLKLIYTTAKTIDQHLYLEFIGSYEVLKYYITHQSPKIVDFSSGAKAKWLQKHLGHEGAHPVGTDYYKELLCYYENL